MKKITEISIILLLLSSFIYLNSEGSHYKVGDGWFSYYDITDSWQEKKANLDNFGYTLDKNPKFIGYIGFYVGQKDTLKHVKADIKRAKRYLINEYKVDENRLVVIEGKSIRKVSQIILQPHEENLPPPNF